MCAVAAASGRLAPRLLVRLRREGGFAVLPASRKLNGAQRQRQYSRIAQRGACCSASAHSPPAVAAEPLPKKKLAVFVSGGGSNFKAIQAAIADGSVHGEVVAVVSNAPSCGGAEFARGNGIPVLTYPAPKSDPAAGLTADQLVQQLAQDFQVDYVILAGYLKLIPSQLCRAFRRRIVNIHPGLLPSFGGKGYYGIKVHQAVIASGARFSGPTIHFVDEKYDTGPILAQAVVPVYPTDRPEQLAARVLKQEHQLYPRCVAALCDDRVTWRADGIPIMWSAE